VAIVNVGPSGPALRDRDAIAWLAGIGIDYERWMLARNLPETASAEQILSAYATRINAWKLRGGYATADVIDVWPHTPDLDDMIAKFNREHWHSEDEVRFVIEGGGIFWIRDPHGRLVAIEVEPGDMIRVPDGTRHWFTLREDRRIRAIRLFQDPAGWTPHYTAAAA
jgi:1,2-dihydroxy-3-keto-5-methylthiopentene dioxygenase